MQRVPGVLGQINRFDLLSGPWSKNDAGYPLEGGSMKKQLFQLIRAHGTRARVADAKARRVIPILRG